MVFVPPTPVRADALRLAAELGDHLRSEQVDHPTLEIGWGRATTVVDAPLSQVEATAADYSDYDERIPALRQSRVLSRQGSGAQIYLEGAVLGALTLWANIRMVARDGSHGERIIEAQLQSGNVSTFLARWTLEAIDPERTLVRFELLVDPDLPVPNRLITLGNQEAARQMVLALRRRHQ